MKVITADEDEIVLGTTETRPTISIRDFSRRVTDDFGVTRVVKRNFQRLMSVRMTLPFDSVSDVQNSLAALRATAAQWVASEDYDWLNFSGFYKDFSLDLAVPPNSFCTLTVEGLAESEPGVTDAGTDPAPTGTSTLKLVQPTLVDESVLVSSNVPETDWPEWSAITIYPAGARVIKAALHRVYESVVDTNVGNDPAGDSGKWTEVGPTNRWAMFDEALGSVTEAAGDIIVTVNASGINSVALIDVGAATVRVQAADYDETRSAASGSALFLDLPTTDGDITVTISDPLSWVSVGTMLIGNLVTLGVTEESPTAGITDYSKKEVDDFGEATIVERAWAKRSELRSLIRTDAIDIVANRVASVRAQPSLWIGDEAVGALIIYGFFKDFSIEVDQAVSTVSVSIEGLSKAAPISDAGAIAVFEKNFYRRSATQPATPTGGSFDFVTRDIVAPVDWSASIEDGDDPVWVSIAIAAKTGSGGSAPFTGHTVPVKVFQDGVDGAPGAPGTDGAPGAPGANGQTLYTHYAYADAPDGSFNFTTGSPGDRTYQGVRYNQTSATESTNPADYDWSPYVGPPNFGLAAFNSNSVVAGNKLIKVAGATDWDASIHSTESFKSGAAVSFVVDLAAQFMLGLNTDPTSDASYSSIDFAIYVNGADVEIYESGVPQTSMGIAPVPGDVFSIVYNNKAVIYSKNGTPFYTNSAPAADLTLFLDSSMVYPGVQVGRILSFTAAGPAGEDGANGAPGDDGISPVAISISPSTATVNVDKDGQVKSGQLPLDFVVTAMQAGNPISLTSLTITDSYGGTFAEDDSKITLSALSDDNAQVQFTAVAGGQTIAGLVIAIATARDGAGGASATINTDATLTIANQTSYTQVGNQIAMNVSSAGKLKVNFSGMIRPETVAGYQWQSKIQYSLNGGSTWVDVSGSAKDSSATFELDVPPFGMRGGTLSSASPITVTGLTADAPALIRGMVQRKSGSATASGTISGVLTLYAEQVL